MGQRLEVARTPTLTLAAYRLYKSAEYRSVIIGLKSGRRLSVLFHFLYQRLDQHNLVGRFGAFDVPSPSLPDREKQRNVTLLIVMTNFFRKSATVAEPHLFE